MSDDENDRDLSCGFCGDSVAGKDAMLLKLVRAIPAKRGFYLDGSHEDPTLLHRYCVQNWLEGYWIRIESDVRLPGDE